MSVLSKLWRLIATALSFALFGLSTVLLSVCLLVFVGLPPFSKLFKRRLSRRVIALSARLYIHVMRGLGVLTFTFEGTEHINTPGTLVIANHPTLLDVVFLMAVMPDTTFIVKATMAKNPFTAVMVSLAGYIPNSEIGMELIEKAVAAINRGETLMIFPEGTRTISEDGLQFKRGAANIALQANCLIQPVLIRCEPITLRKHEKWYAVPERAPLFTIRALARINLLDCVDNSKPPGIRARELNRFIQNKFTDGLLTDLPKEVYFPKD